MWEAGERMIEIGMERTEGRGGERGSEGEKEMG